MIHKNFLFAEPKNACRIKKIRKREKYRISVSRTNLYLKKNPYLQNGRNCLSYKNSMRKSRYPKKPHCYSVSHRSSKISENNSFTEININTNLFRKLLNKEHREFFDKKMNIHKDISPEELVIVNKKMIQCGRYSYNQEKKRLIQRKRMKLKFIDIGPIKDLNPIKEIRIFNYVHPFERASNDPEGHNCQYKQLSIKRVVELIYDPDCSQYIIKLEERFPMDHDIKGMFSKVSYYIKWLESLGETIAKKFSDAINNQIKGLFMSDYFCSQICDRMKDGGDTRKKLVLSELSEETKNYIHQKPHYTRSHTLDIEYNQGTLHEIRFNKQFCELVGNELTMSQCNDKDSENVISVLTASRTSNWMEGFTNVVYDVSSLATENMFKDKCFSLGKHIFVMDVKGRKIPGYFKVFRESYVKNCIINYTTYAVYEVDESWQPNKKTAITLN